MENDLIIDKTEFAVKCSAPIRIVSMKGNISNIGLNCFDGLYIDGCFINNGRKIGSLSIVGERRNP